MPIRQGGASRREQVHKRMHQPSEAVTRRSVQDVNADLTLGKDGHFGTVRAEIGNKRSRRMGISAIRACSHPQTARRTCRCRRCIASPRCLSAVTGYSPGRGATGAARLLPRRVHFPIQSPHVALAGLAVLPAARAGCRDRLDHPSSHRREDG